ncbi:MAG: hypothetical protein Kow0090_03730 [Myxococcota bacterium]
MSKSKNKIRWEAAILEVIKECDGSATLKQIYEEVAKKRQHPNANHIIRAFLYRMSRVTGELTKIGLGIYALPNRNIVESADLHSNMQGMLLELGNIYGYLTYTANPSSKFKGIQLKNFATITPQNFPVLFSSELSSIARTIDIIWFKSPSRAPKHTFDIERTTDFSKALSRAYQLRDFRITFYVVALKNRKDQFQRRVAREPYNEIKQRVLFRSYEDISSLYEAAIKHSELKNGTIMEP